MVLHSSSVCARPCSSDPVTLADGPAVTLIWSLWPGLPSSVLPMFEVQLGFILDVINLDLSESRPICCSRLTMTSAVRPEEGRTIYELLFIGTGSVHSWTP